MKSLFNFALSCFAFASVANAQLSYPQPKKIPQVETRFGVAIEDSFKWMENPSDPDLWGWIEEQKALTAGALDSNVGDEFARRTLEFRKLREEQAKVTEAAEARWSRAAAPGLEDDLRSMGIREQRFIKWEEPSRFLKSVPVKAESALYKLQSQAVHSGDLRRVIVSQKSDNKVVDILLVKFYTFIAWENDESFYYISDLDERIGGGKPGLFRHTVGEVQSEDVLLLTGRTSSSDLTVHQVGPRFFAEVDGTIGALQLSTGRLTNRIPVNGEIVEMTSANDAEATVLSFRSANYGEFQQLRLRDGQRRLLLGERDFVLEKTKRLGAGAVLVIGVRDGAHVAGVLSPLGELTMIPGLADGTIDYVSHTEDTVKLSFENYAQPKSIYAYDLKTAELKLLAKQSYPIEIESEKIFYTASTGQRASVWIMRKKGVALTATTPVILFGYGGFRVQITPAFGIYESLSWMEKGGAFAVATIPGSLDYGDAWWQVARNAGRTHSFDSFALAAKELIARGWTSSEHIGMMGASNGGTLVAGTLQRHPELFKAAVPIVGVMDLLNFPLFTAGKYWTNDYGNPFTERDFRGILPLSPYHALERKAYPATLVMTAEFDDRVVPMHSYKYVARLQEYNTSAAPILLYNKEWGGHGRASGSARESSRFVSAFYTFFAQQLGL
jgi:prolyl oligopeptidase